MIPQQMKLKHMWDWVVSIVSHDIENTWKLSKNNQPGKHLLHAKQTHLSITQLQNIQILS